MKLSAQELGFYSAISRLASLRESGSPDTCKMSISASRWCRTGFNYVDKDAHGTEKKSGAFRAGQLDGGAEPSCAQVVATFVALILRFGSVLSLGWL